MFTEKSFKIEMFTETSSVFLQKVSMYETTKPQPIVRNVNPIVREF